MRHGSAAGRFRFHQDAMGAGASRVHDQHLRRLDDFSLLVPALSLRSWQRALLRPWMGSRALLRDSDPARHPGRRDRSACAQDDVAGAARRVPAPSKNRAMDLAAMDVRVSNRRDRLPDAVQVIPADLSAGFAASGRRLRFAVKDKKRRAVHKTACAQNFLLPFLAKGRGRGLGSYAFALGRLDTA